MRKSHLLLALACALHYCASPSLAQSNQAKSNLKVLVVSHDPENPKSVFAKEEPRTLELLGERAALWDAFLQEHFNDVRVVYGPDYKVEMSEQADVTLFDVRPPALKKSSRTTNPETGEEQYHAAEYLPADFTHAALMIAENSPLIGEPLGSKLDWL